MARDSLQLLSRGWVIIPFFTSLSILYAQIIMTEENNYEELLSEKDLSASFESQRGLVRKSLTAAHCFLSVLL